MTVIDVVVIVATVLASAGLLWFFFGTRRFSSAPAPRLAAPRPTA